MGNSSSEVDESDDESESPSSTSRQTTSARHYSDYRANESKSIFSSSSSAISHQQSFPSASSSTAAVSHTASSSESNASSSSSSTSSSSNTTLALECDICFQSFDEKDHLPKGLSCGHSVCASCLAQLCTETRAAARYNFPCHECRRPIALSEVFPTLFLVTRLLREAREKSSTSATPQVRTLRTPPSPSASAATSASSSHHSSASTTTSSYFSTSSSLSSSSSSCASSRSAAASTLIREWSVGLFLEVLNNVDEKWLPAEVVEYDHANSRIRIRYEDSTARWHEWIELKDAHDSMRIRPLGAGYQLPTPASSPSSAFAAASAGSVCSVLSGVASHPTEDGSYLDCRDSTGKWLAGQIIARGNMAGNGTRALKIHFLEYESKWDEWIQENNRRRLASFREFSSPLGGPTAPFQESDDVQVLYSSLRDDEREQGGKWYRAKVVKVDGWQVYCEITLEGKRTLRWFHFKQAEIRPALVTSAQSSSSVSLSSASSASALSYHLSPAAASSFSSSSWTPKDSCWSLLKELYNSMRSTHLQFFRLTAASDLSALYRSLEAFEAAIRSSAHLGEWDKWRRSQWTQSLRTTSQHSVAHFATLLLAIEKCLKEECQTWSDGDRQGWYRNCRILGALDFSWREPLETQNRATSHQPPPRQQQPLFNFFERFVQSDDFPLHGYLNDDGFIGDVQATFDALANWMQWGKRSRRQHYFEFRENVATYAQQLASGDSLLQRYESGLTEHSSVLRTKSDIRRAILVHYDLTTPSNAASMTDEELEQWMEEKLFVNIYDFVSHSKKRFSTLAELRQYSISNQKIFPLELAKDDEILRQLLHTFFHNRAR